MAFLRISSKSRVLTHIPFPCRYKSWNNKPIISEGIHIKAIPDDIKSTISMRDYTKMTLVKTSINIGKIGLFGAGSMCFYGPMSVMANPYVAGISGIVGGTGLAVYSLMQFAKESPKIIYNDNQHHLVDSSKRNMYLNMFLLGEGITLGPLLIIGSGYIIPATLITTGIMAGPIASAYLNPVKKDNLIGVSNFLYTSLLGICGLGLTSLIFPSFGALYMKPEPYIGILLFSGYNWYDTQMMMESYKENRLDPSGHSVNYTLNFINIFIRVMELLARMQQNKKE